MGKIIKNGVDYSPTIHMPANTATQAGAVAAGGSNYNKVWGTDSEGNPGWVEASGGGHTIKNDSGTSLAQKDNLLFKGIYTQNNGDNTEVDIVRQLTKAQIDALSGEAAKGFMEATDESGDLPLMANMVEYSTGVSVKDKIDILASQPVELMASQSISTTETSYELNYSVADYRLVFFYVSWNGGMPSNYLVTLNGAIKNCKVHVNADPNNAYVQIVEFTDNTHVKLVSSNATVYMAIYGLK